MWIKNPSIHNLTTARKAAEEEREKQHAAQRTASGDLWVENRPGLRLPGVPSSAAAAQPRRLGHTRSPVPTSSVQPPPRPKAPLWSPLGWLED